MAEDQHRNDPIAKLSNVSISPTDRQEIWQELELQMHHLEGLAPRKRRKRILGRVITMATAGVAAAVVVGVLVTNGLLPMQKPQQQVEPPSTHVTPPTTPSEPPSHVTQPGDNHAVTPPTPDTAQQTAEEMAQRAEVQTILQRARQGKVPGADFAAHTNLIDDVKKAWGDPEKQDTAGKGFYATYTQRGYAFGFNKGSQLFDVRSYQPEIQKIKLTAVQAELGTPDHLNRLQNPNQDVLIYQVNDLYQLQLIFPHPTEQNPNPNLDHISVFCEQDSHNLMAGW
jgi:hypothetical protein